MLNLPAIVADTRISSASRGLPTLTACLGRALRPQGAPRCAPSQIEAGVVVLIVDRHRVLNSMLDVLLSHAMLERRRVDLHRAIVIRNRCCIDWRTNCRLTRTGWRESPRNVCDL